MAAAVGALCLGGWAKTVKVLTIGNSFSVCLLKQLPACAAALPDCTLDLCSLYIGGCSLERHWQNVSAATNAAFRPYRVDWSYASVTNPAAAPVARVTGPGEQGAVCANIPELLTADAWDVVTLQQASHASWRPGTYHPFGDRLVAFIRARAPQAEIRVQQTWAYAPPDARLASWGLDQAGMYARLRSAYAAFAAAHGLRLIPTGDAVQRFRAAMPAPDGLAGDPCGRPGGRDWFHLNREGEYLQACVWLAALFDADVTRLAYAPAFMSPARAAQMRACAQAAVRDAARPPAPPAQAPAQAPAR